jgi:hypothetical protein
LDFIFDYVFNFQGKNTLRPPKIVITNIAFLHLVFYISIDITFWIIFVCLEYIGLDSNLKQSLKKKLQQTLVNFNI